MYVHHADFTWHRTSVKSCYQQQITKISARMHFTKDCVGSGVARPGPNRACALPSTSQALPSPTQLESRDSTMNQIKAGTKVKNIYLSYCANRYRSI